MQPIEPRILLGPSEHDLRAVHALFARRIGSCLVEDLDSFRESVRAETPDWIPRLVVAEVDGRIAGAQLGGLLPAVKMLSLPYTAVDERCEGRGIYRAMKTAMLDELFAEAGRRGLPAPIGNVSEEAFGSAQYERKVVRGRAIALPFAYEQPAVQGLARADLALTFEPLTDAAPAFTADDYVRIVAAVFRGLYRIAEPAHDPTFRRIARGLRRDVVASTGHANAS